MKIVTLIGRILPGQALVIVTHGHPRSKLDKSIL
jgi:hypothetical protein